MAEKSDDIKRIFELEQKLRQPHLMRGEPPPHLPWMTLNLTMVQLRTLFLIVRQRKATCRELANAMGVTPANITRIADRLVEQGLVTRKTNPQDRRVIMLRGTGKAQRMINEMEEARASMLEIMRGHLATILEAMSPEDLSALAQGLSGFAAAAEASAGARGETEGGDNSLEESGNDNV